MLINYDAKPADSIYYVGCCILQELQNEIELDVLFRLTKLMYNENLTYTDFILALDFLFIMDKLNIKDLGGVIFVHKNDEDQ